MSPLAIIMAFTNRTYDKLCHDVNSDFDQLFTRNYPAKFATLLDIQAILTDGRLAKLYNSLVSRKPAFLNREKDESTKLPPTVDSFRHIIVDKMLYEFLAVLLYAKCNKTTARNFVAKMVVGEQAIRQEKRDEKPYHLPQEMQGLIELFENHGDAQRFFDTQQHFCVMVLGGPDVITIKANDKRTLPWVNDRHLGDGSFGVVDKVIISPNHLADDKSFSTFNPKKVAVARKSFKGAVNPERSFNQEMQTIRKIFSGDLIHENILGSLAAIIEQKDPPNFYLLMPLAKTDLECYMKQDRVMDMALKTSLLNSAAGLAEGLAFLHKGIRQGKESYICYHLDLKPANVLLFKDEGSSNSSHDMVWKLSDFGISKVKAINTSEEQEEERSLFDLFQRQRPQLQPGGASDTLNLRGIGPFLPPEARSRRAEMNEKSDIWSLGCIISVLFTYMAFGRQGVEDYAKARGRQEKHRREIFWESAQPYGIIINREVPLKHQELINEAQIRSSSESRALKHMLDFLKGSVFKVAKEERCDAGEISQQLKNMPDYYKGADHPRASIESKSATRKSSEQLQTPSGSSNVKRWRMGSTFTERFNGCDTSPDGNFMVYWNAKTITVFDKDAAQYDAGAPSDSNDQPRKSPLYFFRRSSTDIPGEVTLKSLDSRQPHDPRESWKAAELTNDHLVAMTTTGEASFCYVFLLTGQNKLDTYCRKELSGKTVHFLSACLDQETLICLLTNSSGRKTLWRASIGFQLPPPATESSSSMDTASSSRDADCRPRPILVGAKSFNPMCPAEEIIHIVLETQNFCYMVIRKHDKPYELLVALYNLNAGKISRQPLTLRRDSDTKSSLFSDITCLRTSHGRPAVIMITHFDTIWHFKSGDDGSLLPPEHHQQIKHYRILKVARCMVTARLFALGFYTGNDNIVLLEIGLKATDVRPTVEMVAKLNGLSKSSEVLHLRISYHKAGDSQGDRSQDGKLAAQVIAVRLKPKEYCVYRVDVR